MNLIKILLGVFFTIFIVILFNFTHIKFLKLYPVLANFFIFLVFFISLFGKETIIQFFAKKMEGHELPEISKKYTRNLTYIWCVYLFINFSISVFSVFFGEKFWTLYNGVISYILTGTIFVIEYIVRISFKRKYNV